jgi:hypothetical protein
MQDMRSHGASSSLVTASASPVSGSLRFLPRRRIKAATGTGMNAHINEIARAPPAEELRLDTLQLLPPLVLPQLSPQLPPLQLSPPQLSPPQLPPLQLSPPQLPPEPPESPPQLPPDDPPPESPPQLPPDDPPPESPPQLPPLSVVPSSGEHDAQLPPHPL